MALPVTELYQRAPCLSVCLSVISGRIFLLFRLPPGTSPSFGKDRTTSPTGLTNHLRRHGSQEKHTMLLWKTFPSGTPAVTEARCSLTWTLGLLLFNRVSEVHCVYIVLPLGRCQYLSWVMQNQTGCFSLSNQMFVFFVLNFNRQREWRSEGLGFKWDSGVWS